MDTMNDRKKAIIGEMVQKILSMSDCQCGCCHMGSANGENMVVLVPCCHVLCETCEKSLAEMNDKCTYCNTRNTKAMNYTTFVEKVVSIVESGNLPEADLVLLTERRKQMFETLVGLVNQPVEVLEKINEEEWDTYDSLVKVVNRLQDTEAA